jgi:hypothetical protein
MIKMDLPAAATCCTKLAATHAGSPNAHAQPVPAMDDQGT